MDNPKFFGGIIPELCNIAEGIVIDEGVGEWVWSATVHGDYQMKTTHENIKKKKNAIPWHKIV